MRTGSDGRLATFADLVHPFDESARRRLESMPELPVLLAALPPVNGSDLRPEVRRLLPPICGAFGIAEPVLRLETGDLIDHLAPDEIEAVLAHECGHVLLGHVAYRTLFDHPAVPAPVRGALAAWVRAAELSADRAAAAYQGGADAITRVLFRLAGAVGAPPSLVAPVASLPALLSPGDADPGAVPDCARSARARPGAVGARAFAVRVREIQAWTATPAFARLRPTVARGT